MKQTNTEVTQLEDQSWVDVHDEDLMIALGIHPPFAALKDPYVWTKTYKEKKLLAGVKHKTRMHFSIGPIRSIPVKAKLIIYLRKNKRFPKTTYSIVCWQHEIPFILSQYSIRNKHTNAFDSIVIKYVYNGRTYNPGELPFWKVSV